MNQEELPPELEKILKRVKLKEPPERLMKDYLSGVNAKIDRRGQGFHVSFPQVALACVIGLSLVGVLYLTFMARPKAIELVSEPIQKVEAKPQVVAVESQVQATQKALSVEEEMAVLEAFSEEHGEGVAEFFGDEEMFEDLSQLDEVELATPPNAPASRV
ncbi:MAG: hypothetical protein HYS55_03090 [Candidatus Omnitrophica bacterium]|nr:hypothetical protein [Candidatus Omnitrophota bacterium]